MGLTGVRVVHAIPGRIRLKIAQVRDNPPLAAAVEEHLGRLPGVVRVEANAVTGSVLVLFQDGMATTDDSLGLLSARWPAELGTFELAAVNGSNGGSGNGHNGTSAVDQRIVEFFGSLNQGVEQVTSGVDLRLLVPLGLFFLGVRSLLFTEKLPGPNWYDFFWFSLSTFFMLNGSVSKAATGPEGEPVVAA